MVHIWGIDLRGVIVRVHIWGDLGMSRTSVIPRVIATSMVVMMTGLMGVGILVVTMVTMMWVVLMTITMTMTVTMTMMVVVAMTADFSPWTAQ